MQDAYIELYGSLMRNGAARCVAVTDEVGPGFSDYSFDRTHYKLFKKDGSEMIDGKYVLHNVAKYVCGYLVLLVVLFKTQDSES